MRTDAFDFDLPADRIAQRPASPREAARLLEVGAGLRDFAVGDLPGLLRPGDALVVNDTKVIPARLIGRRGAARIEATLTGPADGAAEAEWSALLRPARRLRPGDRIAFADGFSAVVAALDGGAARLRFADGLDLAAALDRHGRAPLPPYIARADGPDARDRADYQTVYAREDGAVAAPTAGLHLTRALLRRIEARGVRIVPVTLHVGVGTFLPVRSATVDGHVMHAERGRVGPVEAAALRAARESGGRVVAVGTTAVRLLESAADAAGAVMPFDAETQLFVAPGHRFRAVDALLTNFHQPRSTPFMLVAAFCGLARMKAAYAHAVQAGYRFYSYGDATFLHRAEGAR